MSHHRLSSNDWDDLAREPEFRSLMHDKQRFIVPATVFFLAYFLALPILSGFAPQLMRRPVLGSVTFGVAFALSQFAMTWVIMGLYLWRARSFDLAEAALVKNARKDLRE